MRIGLPGSNSCSLAKATIEPVNEIEPMMQPITIATFSPVPMLVLCENSPSETSAAVAPPMPL